MASTQKATDSSEMTNFDEQWLRHKEGIAWQWMLTTEEEMTKSVSYLLKALVVLFESSTGGKKKNQKMLLCSFKIFL